MASPVCRDTDESIQWSRGADDDPRRLPEDHAMSQQSSYDLHAQNANPSIPLNTRTRTNGPVVITDYDTAWPTMYQHEAERIRTALGDRALAVKHVGSTVVLSLPAKPCIDILLAVENSADEPAYVPDLEAAGYVLRIREPEWHEHRVFKGNEINLNLHVWTIGDPEIERHLTFRDWLRAHDSDRDRYAEVKRALAGQHWPTMQDYADAKDDIVREIHERIRSAAP